MIEMTPDVSNALTQLSQAIGRAMRAEGLTQAQMDRITARALDEFEAQIDGGYVHVATVTLGDGQ